MCSACSAARADSLPFETVAARFRLIENAQLPVIVRWDQRAREVIEELAYAPYCGTAARLLQPYIVQIPRQAHELLCRCAAIQPVARERYGEQFMVLENPDLYDDDFGLHWQNPEFLKAEALFM